MASSEVPPMPESGEAPKPKRGRKPKAAAVATPPTAAPLAAEQRLALANEQGPALAPYVVSILRTAEKVGGLQGIDDEKRSAAAKALGVAVIYTIPSLDPIWIVWGSALAAMADCYSDAKLAPKEPPAGQSSATDARKSS